MDWFLYGRDLRHEELTKINSKFTESPNQKRRKIISHVHAILISHVLFQYLWVSQMVAKATWLINIKLYYSMFHKCRIRSLKCSVKIVFLTVLQSSQESIYVGVSY